MTASIPIKAAVEPNRVHSRVVLRDPGQVGVHLRTSHLNRFQGHVDRNHLSPVRLATRSCGGGGVAGDSVVVVSVLGVFSAIAGAAGEPPREWHPPRPSAVDRRTHRTGSSRSTWFQGDSGRPLAEPQGPPQPEPHWERRPSRLLQERVPALGLQPVQRAWNPNTRSRHRSRRPKVRRSKGEVTWGVKCWRKWTDGSLKGF